MKKIFIAFIAIASVLLISLISANYIINGIRKETSITNYTYSDDLSYNLYDRDSIDFDQLLIDRNVFNSSIKINDISSLDYYNDFNGMFLACGSIKNQTNENHGLLSTFQIKEYSINQYSLEQKSSFVYNSADENEYIRSTLFYNSNSSGIHIGIFGLRHITISSQYTLDIFEMDSNQITLNQTLNLTLYQFGIIFEMHILDVNLDGLTECFILGENSSKVDYYQLGELSFNLTTSQYQLTNIIEWSTSNQQIIDMTALEELDQVNFIITSVKSPAIETVLKSISITRTEPRNFTSVNNITLNYGSDMFRVYSIDTYQKASQNIKGIILFGTYINNSNNYPCFVLVQYDTGIFQQLAFKMLQSTPNWSLDGLNVDLDLDGNDEIILTTYDLLGSSNSIYGIFDQNLELVEQKTSSLQKIKTLCLSKSLTWDPFSAWFGKDGDGNYVIEFFSAKAILSSIISNSNYLIENYVNKIRFNTYQMNGSIFLRDDLKVTCYLTSHPFVKSSINSTVNELLLSVFAIDQMVIKDVLLIQVNKSNLILSQQLFIIYIIKLPSLSMTLPPLPIILRESGLENSVVLIMENDYNFTISYICTLTSDYSPPNQITNNTILPNAYVNETLYFFLETSQPDSVYEDTLILEIKSNIGTFLFEKTVKINIGLRIIAHDFMNLFYTGLVIFSLSIVVFMYFIYKQNKTIIKNHITKDKPLSFEIPWFKKFAIKSLTDDFTLSQKWDHGIKLSEKFNLPHLKMFHEERARNYLLVGQEFASHGKFLETLESWTNARHSLEALTYHQYLDILDWYLEPLSRIVEIKNTTKGEKKANALLNEFNALVNMRKQENKIFDIELVLPLYLIAEELGAAFKDTNDLVTSSNYLQFAYQYAPDEVKPRIVNAITELISLGLIPSAPPEVIMNVDKKLAKEKLAQKVIRCFSCGSELTFVAEKCPNCDIELVKCSVCKLPITFGSTILECKHCSKIAHSEHLLEWIKIKGTCPVCQHTLKVDEVVQSTTNKS